MEKAQVNTCGTTWEKSLISKPQSFICDMEAIIAPSLQGWRGD